MNDSKPQDPFFARFLEDADYPSIETGMKAGTGCDFTYTAMGNFAVLTDVTCFPGPPGPPLS